MQRFKRIAGFSFLQLRLGFGVVSAVVHYHIAATNGHYRLDLADGLLAGTNRIDLTAFDIEGIDKISMTVGDGGVTIALTDIGGGSGILLAGLTSLTDAVDFVV